MLNFADEWCLHLRVLFVRPQAPKLHPFTSTSDKPTRRHAMTAIMSSSSSSSHGVRVPQPMLYRGVSLLRHRPCPPRRCGSCHKVGLFGSTTCTSSGSRPSKCATATAPSMATRRTVVAAGVVDVANAVVRRLEEGGKEGWHVGHCHVHISNHGGKTTFKTTLGGYLNGFEKFRCRIPGFVVWRVK